MSNAFDWTQFFEQHGIEYVTHGPNVGRGEIGVRCPFCGPADPSQHMSINLEGRGWVCRRNRSEHRGRSPVGLVRALIGCSREEAQRITGAPLLAGAENMLSQVESLLGAAPAAPAAPAPGVGLAEPREFKKFEGKPSQRPYMRYLVRRGFPESFVRIASINMGLRYCARGPFAGRVIFLVHRGGRLITWTGRAISPRARLRYRALSPDPEIAARDGLPAAETTVERCLLWFDDLLAGGSLLEVVEGPADALKLRALGHRHATCLFTNTPSRGQVDLLREGAPGFEGRVVLLDRGAEAQALGAARELAALGFRAAWLPAGADDPGELTPELLAKVRY